MIPAPAARALLADHLRSLATAANVTDWPAYLRDVADGHDEGTSYLHLRAEDGGREHVERAEELLAVARGRRDEDGDVEWERPDGLVYLQRADAIAMAGVHALLAQLGDGRRS